MNIWGDVGEIFKILSTAYLKEWKYLCYLKCSKNITVVGIMVTLRAKAGTDRKASTLFRAYNKSLGRIPRWLIIK